MRKILTAAIFTLTLTGLAVSAAPEAEAASIINPSKAAIVDVVNDMNAVQQVRGHCHVKRSDFNRLICDSLSRWIISCLLAIDFHRILFATRFGSMPGSL